MAALTALGDLHHPMAAMALAAAVGSGDRVTRFAAGIRLTETPSGIVLLRDLAQRDQGAAGDTARIVLWGSADPSGAGTEPRGPTPSPRRPEDQSPLHDSAAGEAELLLGRRREVEPT